MCSLLRSVTVLLNRANLTLFRPLALVRFTLQLPQLIPLVIPILRTICTGKAGSSRACLGKPCLDLRTAEYRFQVFVRVFLPLKILASK